MVGLFAPSPPPFSPCVPATPISPLRPIAGSFVLAAPKVDPCQGPGATASPFHCLPRNWVFAEGGRRPGNPLRGTARDAFASLPVHLLPFFWLFAAGQCGKLHTSPLCCRPSHPSHYRAPRLPCHSLGACPPLFCPSPILCPFASFSRPRISSFPCPLTPSSRLHTFPSSRFPQHPPALGCPRCKGTTLGGRRVARRGAGGGAGPLC